MQSLLRRPLVALVAVVLSGSAVAQETAAEESTESSGPWSMIAARTVGMDQNALLPEAGYPKIGLIFYHGISDKLDFGAKFDFNYGSDIGFGISPEIRLNATLRVALLSRKRVSVALTLDPGVGLNFAGGGFGVAPMLPIGLQVGIHPAEVINIALGVDLMPTFYIIPSGLLAGGFLFSLPILLGPGLEFFVDPAVALTFNFRFGPGIAVGGGPIDQFGNNATVAFSFRGLMGVAIKL